MVLFSAVPLISQKHMTNIIKTGLRLLLLLLLLLYRKDLWQFDFSIDEVPA